MEGIEIESRRDGRDRVSKSLLIWAFCGILLAGIPAWVTELNVSEGSTLTDEQQGQAATNLTRQAQDIQILVFSCRQKAFRDLGGRSLLIRRPGADLEAAQ